MFIILRVLKYGYGLGRDAREMTSTLPGAVHVITINGTAAAKLHRCSRLYLSITGSWICVTKMRCIGIAGYCPGSVPLRCVRGVSKPYLRRLKLIPMPVGMSKQIIFRLRIARNISFCLHLFFLMRS